MPVLGEQQGDQLRVNGFVASEIPAQKPADQIAIDRRVVSWKVNVFQFRAYLFEIRLQLLDLRGFPSSVQTFQNDQHND